MIVHFGNLAEVHAFDFVVRDFETIFYGSFWYRVFMLLGFSFYSSHIFEAVTNEEVNILSDTLISEEEGDRFLS